MSYHRSLVEDARFTQDFDYYRTVYPAIDLIHEWLTWTLTDDPRIGEVDERAPDFRYLKTPARGTIPQFWIFYSFDANSIYLHSILVAKS